MSCDVDDTCVCRSDKVCTDLTCGACTWCRPLPDLLDDDDLDDDTLVDWDPE